MKDLEKTRSYSRKFIIIGVTLIVILGITLGYLTADLYNKYNLSKDIAKNQNLSNVSKVSASDVRLQANSTILYKRIYRGSNDVVHEEKVAEENMLGKTKGELEQLFVGWEIKDISKDQLVLEKYIDGYSPNSYKIGTTDVDGEKMVAVYRFDIEGKEYLGEVTGTPTALLHEDETRKLEEGIYVNSEEKLYEMLENYDE